MRCVKVVCNNKEILLSSSHMQFLFLVFTSRLLCLPATFRDTWVRNITCMCKCLPDWMYMWLHTCVCAWTSVYVWTSVCDWLYAIEIEYIVSFSRMNCYILFKFISFRIFYWIQKVHTSKKIFELSNSHKIYKFFIRFFI